MHINCLKALAAFLVIKCFTRDCRSVIILLRMDNTSAITYEQAWEHNFTKFDSHNKKLGSGACRTPTGSTERDHRQGIACDE